MIIVITGTPGTGKTTIAKLLAKQLDANLVSISSVVAKKHCKFDRQRRTKIIDLKSLQKLVNKKLVKGRINIIEGHLSHNLKADLIVILRTRPDTLKRRLVKKNWSKTKIKENEDAEILGVITVEVMQLHKKRVYELDTSKISPSAAARAITKLLNKHVKMKYGVGRIDWSEKYKNELIS